MKNLKKIKNLEGQRDKLANRLNNLDWRLVNLKEDLVDNKNYFGIIVPKEEKSFWTVRFILNEIIYNSLCKNLTPSEYNMNYSFYNGPETANEFYKNILTNFVENEDFFVLDEDKLER